MALARRTFLAVAAGVAIGRAAPARLRAAIIGHTGRGNYGHGWDTAWRGVDAVEVVAVADPDAEGRAKALERTGARKGYADYREMLAAVKPDLVNICPRSTDQRLEMLTAAIDAGAHVLMEKPFAGSLPEADRIVKLAEARGIRIQVGHQARLAPIVAQVKRLLHDGAIGDLLEIRTRGKEDRRAGGEDMIVLGSHIFDLLRYFAGDPQWVFGSVTQDGAPIAARHVRQGTEPVGWVAGDRISAMFGFPGSQTAYFESKASRDSKGERYGMTFHGSRGALDIRMGLRPPVRILRSPDWLPREDARWEAVPPPPGEDLEDRELANRVMALDLLDAIRSGREPACSALDGRWTIEMTAGIYGSQIAGKPLRFPLTGRRDPLETLRSS
jgi:predicted dehydrogenase